MSDDLEFNVRGLDILARVLGGPMPTARVGILSDKPRAENKTTVTFEDLKLITRPRGKGGPKLSNAQIGAVHEFGDATHPQRSFLRVPIADHLQKEMEASGAFDKRTIDRVIQEKSIAGFVKKIAVLGEKIVLGAFSSGGYGKWPEWKPGYSNNTGDILVDSTQLRNSITSAVVGGR